MDTQRFISAVSEQFICPICLLVVYDPIQVSLRKKTINRTILRIIFKDAEEHMFCKKCIEEWLENHPNCPVDRADMTNAELKPITRVVRNLLNELVFHFYSNIYLKFIFKL
jgi:E3 ubiquitin-protein ligase NRDP1